MTDRDRLRMIAERLAAATPGPWHLDREGRHVGAGTFSGEHLPWLIAQIKYGLIRKGPDEAPANAALIANAPADLAFLLPLASMFLDVCEEKMGNVIAAERERAVREFRARVVEFVRKSWDSPNIARDVEALPLAPPDDAGTPDTKETT